MASVLSVNDLTTHFFTADGVVRAVEDVSFDLKRSALLANPGAVKVSLLYRSWV